MIFYLNLLFSLRHIRKVGSPSVPVLGPSTGVSGDWKLRRPPILVGRPDVVVFPLSRAEKDQKDGLFSEILKKVKLNSKFWIFIQK